MESRLLDEAVILRQVRDGIQRTGSLTDDGKQQLLEVFKKRFNQAQELVEGGKVRKYVFNPSGRTIWAVTGKSGDYQVMPESMFCNCDDYFFRVMGGKKQLCYHLIAQQLASVLGKYNTNDLADTEYSKITSKWTPRQVQS